MENSELNADKSFNKASNNQQKLANAVNSIDSKEANLNEHHNTKKQSMGPNTKR